MKDVHVVFAMCKLKDLQIERGKAISSCVIFHESPDKKVRICTFGQLDQWKSILHTKACIFFHVIFKDALKTQFRLEETIETIKALDVYEEW